MHTTSASLTATDSEDATGEPHLDPHAALQTAVTHVRSEGWESPWGTWLLGEFGKRGESWAVKIDQRCVRRPGSTSPADVLSACWSTVTRFPQSIASADAPWAYLWTAVSNDLSVDITAESMLSERGARRRQTDRPARVTRIGLEVHQLDQTRLDVFSPPPPQFSQGLDALIQILAGGDPEQTLFWTDAVDRALDVMADARRSYEEYTLRRDPYLLHQMGLTPEELSALAALLIGPRRGDRAAQSLLLALRRDPTTPVDSIPGATRRVGVLKARCRHVRRVSTPPSAA